MTHKQKCKDCKKNFKTLTDQEICFNCYVIKFKCSPTTGLYKIEKEVKHAK